MHSKQTVNCKKLLCAV